MSESKPKLTYLKTTANDSSYRLVLSLILGMLPVVSGSGSEGDRHASLCSNVYAMKYYS